MAILVPDKIRYENGLKICEKIIPFGTRCTKAMDGFRVGDLYKADKLLSNGTGKVKGVTIHNTGRIQTASGTTPAEQYTRACWPNQNLKSVRVHYYVDWDCAWQSLREDEVGWHTGDGTMGAGNNTTLSIEIIMNGSGDERDIAAEKNGMILAAHLLKKYGLTMDNLYTHYQFSPIKKRCPVFILPHWDQFKSSVGVIMNGNVPVVNKPDTGTDTVPTINPGTLISGIKVGDTVSFTGNQHYANANALTAKSCKPGLAKVTMIYATGIHPYQLIAVKGGSSTVYGWVNSSDIRVIPNEVPIAPEPISTSKFNINDEVLVNNGAKDYLGNVLPSFVYRKPTFVQKIDGDRVLISPIRNGIALSVKITDIRKIKGVL